MNNADTRSVSRRTVAKGLAWSVPAVTLATQLPAFATSPDPIDIPPSIDGNVAHKCPGNSHVIGHGVIFGPIQVKSTAQADVAVSFSFESSSIYGAVAYVSTDGGKTLQSGSSITVPAGETIEVYVVSTRGSSKNGAGSLTINYTYTVDGVTKSGTTVLSYNSVPPHHKVCDARVTH